MGCHDSGKPGQIKVQHDRSDNDLGFAWGDGTSKSDALAMMFILTNTPLENPMTVARDGMQFGKSFLDEMRDRGYDITTLKAT